MFVVPAVGRREPDRLVCMGLTLEAASLDFAVRPSLVSWWLAGGLSFSLFLLFTKWVASGVCHDLCFVVGAGSAEVAVCGKIEHVW